MATLYYLIPRLQALLETINITYNAKPSKGSQITELHENRLTPFNSCLIS